MENSKLQRINELARIKKERELTTEETAERDALRKRYDEAYGDGYAYAYVYPGVGKVLQAAGRVIRSENDRGALLLIDDRYAADPYPALLPAQWTLRRVFTDKQIAEQLRGFWDQS